MKFKFFDTSLGGKGECPKKLLPPKGKAQIEHWDKKQDGLGLRVTKVGRRSFFVWYRFNGEPRRDTLKPHYPALSISDARKETHLTTTEAAAGDDPRKKDRAPRHHIYLKKNPVRKPPINVPGSYSEAVADYVRREQEGTRKNKTAGEVKRALLKVGEDWEGLAISEITAYEIKAKLEAVRDSGKDHMANHYYAYLSGFFSWCVGGGIEIVETSPMLGMDKPVLQKKLPKRKRADGSKPILNDDELAAIWTAADKESPYPRALVKLALLTGKRPGAIAAMRWSEIDETGYWKPPESDSENKRLHSIPLPALARQIIGALPKVKGNDFVFVGKKDGQHLVPGTNIKNKIRKNSGVSDFAPIQFRHTVETRLGGMRFSYEIRDAVLDHAPARGAGAGYDHHDYDDEKLEALEAWSEAVQNILIEKKVWKKNVIPMGG